MNTALRSLAILALACCMASATALAVPQETGAGDQGLERLQELFTQAEDTFFSANQPASVESFTAIIDEISALPEEELGTELRTLLVRSLSYRAQARLNLGEDSAVDTDLRRILELDPGFEFDPDLVSPKLATRFDELREQLLGHVVVEATPADARVLVDGRTREWREGPIPLLAGSHVVSVERPGYTVVQREISVEGGEEVTIEAGLERTHPVIFLLARPVGAAVTIDGREVGRIREPRPSDPSSAVDEEFSEHPRLVIGDLQVGGHRLRIERQGFRAVEQSFELSELADYRLGPLELERAVGRLVLDGVPRDASIELVDADVDGEWEREAAADGTQRASLELTPGLYSVLVTGPGGALFEADVEVADGGTAEVDVSLRPPVTYLGVLGGDELGRETLATSFETALAQDGHWTLRNRSSEAADILERLQMDVGTFRELGASGPPAWREPFARLQEGLDAELRGSLYVLGVLSDDLVATAADLWLLPAAPGPGFPDRIRLDLEQPGAALTERIADVFRPFEPTRARLGASVVDTGVVDAPVIFEVAEDSPAARAGLQLGDRVRAVDGSELSGAADLGRRVAEAGPRGELLLAIDRGAQSLEVRVPLETSPWVVSPDFSGRPLAPLWTQIQGRLADPDAPAWLLQLNQTAALLRASEWEEAVRLLRRIDAPRGAGVGAGMVEYWLGMALQALGPDYSSLALEAFDRAANQRGARLFHADGPYVWPRATARADALRR